MTKKILRGFLFVVIGILIANYALAGAILSDISLFALILVICLLALLMGILWRKQS